MAASPGANPRRWQHHQSDWIEAIAVLPTDFLPLAATPRIVFGRRGGINQGRRSARRQAIVEALTDEWSRKPWDNLSKKVDAKAHGKAVRRLAQGEIAEAAAGRQARMDKGDAVIRWRQQNRRETMKDPYETLDTTMQGCRQGRCPASRNAGDPHEAPCQAAPQGADRRCKVQWQCAGRFAVDARASGSLGEYPMRWKHVFGATKPPRPG